MATQLQLYRRCKELTRCLFDSMLAQASSYDTAPSVHIPVVQRLETYVS